FYYYFFFSSRRRHTRSKRDWSSDVCSSDLLLYAQQRIRKRRSHHKNSAFLIKKNGPNTPTCKWALVYSSVFIGMFQFNIANWVRSEERRVGKEWRCRRGRELVIEKKKMKFT